MEDKKETCETKSEGAVRFISEVAQPDGSVEQVFYNPVQIFNRDISLLVLKVWARKAGFEEGVNFYDALSATGLSNQAPSA